MNHLVKITALLSFVLVIVCPQRTQAQETTFNNDFARNSVFLELGGNGLLYSLNYDHKFFDHASARIGAMYFPYSNDDPNTFDGRLSILFVPITANYLVGDGNSRLEIGGGPLIVRVSADGEVDNELIDGVGSGVGFTGTLGYRLQPRNGGFLFRIGYTPAFAPGFFQHWAGLSLGATF